ncbi:MAG: toprim domain-containing protein, partial [Candidatus Hodarchaeales archaeon]
MAKQGKAVLVIGEKPSQIKTFSDILFSSVRTTKVGSRLYTRTGNWGGYVLTFLPLIGHITNIDTRKGFGWNECAPIEIAENPKALIIKENPEFRKAIRSLAVSNDELWLATDPDSEGDNIAYEAYTIALRANKQLRANTKRIWNSSLTKDEILRAFQNLQPWSIHQALAVQGRRTIDAWVGFSGTREVTGAARKVRKERGLVLSVGRV